MFFTQDLGQPAKLLAPCNIDHSKLLEYVTDVVKYATKGTLTNLELKIVGNKQPDIAAFDFTSIKKAEHAARIIERKGSKLLVGLVGDSLLEVRCVESPSLRTFQSKIRSVGLICSKTLVCIPVVISHAFEEFESALKFSLENKNKL